jgi:hypothetical protein
MKLVNFLVLFLSVSNLAFGQETVSGRIIEVNTGVGISYVTVVSMDQSNIGAISDENGYFKFTFASELDSVKFRISASSYLAKELYLKNTDLFQPIELEKSIIDLPEVVIIPQSEKEINWAKVLTGRRVYGVSDEAGKFTPMMMGLDNSGEFHGNAFRIKNKILLQEISFHFMKEENYPEILYLRVFSTDDKPKLSENEPLESLTELTAKTIKLDKLQNGFNVLDVTDQNIVANSGYLILAFTADINGIVNNKLTIYQEKSSGKDVLRFALSPQHYNFFPPFLPKYRIGFRYVDLKEKKQWFSWLKNIFK